MMTSRKDFLKSHVLTGGVQGVQGISVVAASGAGMGLCHGILAGSYQH